MDAPSVFERPTTCAEPPASSVDRSIRLCRIQGSAQRLDLGRRSDFAGALIIGVVSPLLVVFGALPVIGGSVAWVLAGAGLVVAVAGSVGAWRAQSAMGSSWRIGVDDTEETALVTDGIFSTVRNPIFTAMIVAQAGTVLMVPTWLGLVGVVLLVLASQLQVRMVEEPYLSNHHGVAYDRYAARTGRFLPGIGHTRRKPSLTADIGGA